MAYANHRIFMLIQVGQTDDAKAEVLSTLKTCRMHKGNAAKKLGCSHATFLRWIKMLELNDEIALLTEKFKKNGKYIIGRPEGTTVANGAARRKPKKRVVETYPSRSSLRRRSLSS